MTHPYQFKSKFFVETINVTTAVFFILFSILKRFTDDDKLMIIPLILFSTNFLILIEFGYKNNVKKSIAIPFKKSWYITQAITNLCFVIYIFYFYSADVGV